MEFVRLNEDNRACALKRATEVLRSGGIAVFPTDTVYGVAAHPAFPSAVKKIYAAKGRDEGKPIAFLASDVSAVMDYCASMPEAAVALARKHWPGALTLVLETAGGYEGFRIPDDMFARELIRLCGGLLRVTSANFSGEAAMDDMMPSLLRFCEGCDIAVDGGKCHGGVESTVARVNSSGRISVLRQGAVEIPSSPCLP